MFRLCRSVHPILICFNLFIPFCFLGILISDFQASIEEASPPIRRELNRWKTSSSDSSEPTTIFAIFSFVCLAAAFCRLYCESHCRVRARSTDVCLWYKKSCLLSAIYACLYVWVYSAWVCAPGLAIATDRRQRHRWFGRSSNDFRSLRTSQLGYFSRRRVTEVIASL